MEKFDNNMIAIICYVISNVVVTAYIYFMKKFNVNSFNALKKLQESILDIVSQPPSARTELIQLTPHEPYPSPTMRTVDVHRDIDLGNGKILRIHPN